MSKVRRGKDKDVDPKKMTFVEALSTEHSNTLDAEKHGSSV